MKKSVFNYVKSLLILFACLSIAGCVSSDKAGVETITEIGTYKSEHVVIGSGTEYELSGILTLPGGVVPQNGFPAAVIVHGSGPGDMDGTVFAYKMYLDIADYLSSNGIAVLRYDKRTLTHGLKMLEELGGALSVYEETIEDVLLAAELLKTDPRINENRVFIIGHSLGAMLAPRIHVMGADFAGLILLAGSPRFLLDISLDQNIDYIENMMEGEEKEAALASLVFWDEQVNAIVNLPDEIAQTIYIQSGVSAYYFKDLYHHPVSAYLQIVNVPFLVMQGSADFQVKVDKDFEYYQQLLAGRDNVTFKLYEGLNHMFITSTTGYIDEYEIPGNVDLQVLNDLARWINTH